MKYDCKWWTHICTSMRDVSHRLLGKPLSHQHRRHHRCHTYHGHATLTIPCGTVHPCLWFVSAEPCAICSVHLLCSVFSESSMAFLFRFAASSFPWRPGRPRHLNPVIGWATPAVHVGHVGLQQAQVCRGVIVETLEVDVLRLESDQDVMRSLQLIRVSSLQDRVNKNFPHGSSPICILFCMQENAEDRTKHASCGSLYLHTQIVPCPYICHSCTL